MDCVANGLLISLAKARLDGETASKIEERMDIHRVYTWVEFKEELEKRANQLACHSDFEEHKPRNVKTVAAASIAQPQRNNNEGKSSKGLQDKPQQQSCFMCGEKGHPIWFCARFKELSPAQRWDKTIKSRRCFNCMSWGHSYQKCPSSKRCHECGEPHHTLLHREDNATEKKPVADSVVQASTSSNQ